MIPYFQKLGVTDLFNEKCDLGLMTTNPATITCFRHKALIDVDENGVTATAATIAIANMRGCRFDKPVVFKADRPFVWYIKHLPTQSVLFIGRFSGPNAK